MIVKSILDTDLYKFTTSYAYMKLFPQARGTFEFFDRDLTEYPEDFVQKVYLELSNLGMLRLTNSELDYMTSNCRFVPQVYWEWLYDIASRHKGLVMSTDNQTEYQLGFWTIHGDFDPIQDLWKTEVYELAKWISNRYKNIEHHHTIMTGAGSKSDAIELSIALTPTDGLGISNSDLEQIGAKSYDEVDDILSRYIPFKEYRQKHGEPLHPHDEMAESDCWSQLCVRHGEDVVNKVWSRHLASEFKRKKAPIYISRELYE